MFINNINSFLDFGYFLRYEKNSYCMDLSNPYLHKYETYSELELIKEGSSRWEQAIADQFDINQQHVVPLSGGLDSRAILATLLKYTEAKNIITYTFGTPNTLDYDIGNQIAKKVGTLHYTFPLTEYKYNIDTLIDVSKRIDHQTLLFLHGPIEILDNEFKNATIWSGAIIDVFFGIHTHKKKGENWNDAIINSFYENQFVKSIKLSNCDYNEYIALVDYDKNYENYYPLEHIIDLMNRQVKFIAPHVLMKGFEYKTLFNTDLSLFANSIPQKYRENQLLYKKMFISAFPELFSIRTKTHFGLSLKASDQAIIMKRGLDKILRKTKLSNNKNVNYLDFDEKIRTKKDLNKIIRNSIYDLKNRDLIDWIDIEKIYKDHINGNGNFGDALITLASLEIHLKSGLQL